MGDRLMVGTRGSALALAQTKVVTDRLTEGGGIQFEVVPIKTAGDVAGPGERGSMDGKTAFTGEIERRLLDGSVDLAVHSMKDLPTKIDDRLVVAATPRRGDPRDALVSAYGGDFSTLRKGARVGTSSARRKAQLLAARRDLEVVWMMGNVETRLRKLETEHLDAVVLASAGLDRLGLGQRISQRFGTDEMVPAVGQGTLAVEARKDRPEVLEILREIDDAMTRASSDCERAFSEELGGDCYVPLGGFAESRDGVMKATGLLADTDGVNMVKSAAQGREDRAADLGRRLAAQVIEEGGGAILKRLKH